MGERAHMKMIFTESERDSLEPEISCDHRLLEVWNGISQLIDEIDLNLLEERDGDPRKKRFQVSVSTSEPKPTEVRKCDTRHDRPMQQLSLDVTTGIVVVRSDPEYL